jgi:hypothetical protein
MIGSIGPDRLVAWRSLMVLRRKIRDEAEARTCIASAKGSKLTAREWTRSEGIDGRSLRAWTLNLERGAGSTKAARPRTNCRRARIWLRILRIGLDEDDGAPEGQRHERYR